MIRKKILKTEVDIIHMFTCWNLLISWKGAIMVIIIKIGEQFIALEDFHSMTYNKMGDYVNIFTKSRDEPIPTTYTIGTFDSIKIMR